MPVELTLEQQESQTVQNAEVHNCGTRRLFGWWKYVDLLQQQTSP